MEFAIYNLRVCEKILYGVKQKGDFYVNIFYAIYMSRKIIKQRDNNRQ